MPDDIQISNYQSTAILKELSDIKSNLAINSTETANIKSTIGEIKNDIREMKGDVINRREHTELVKIVSEQGKQLQNLEYWQIKVGAYATAIALIISYIFRLFTK